MQNPEQREFEPGFPDGIYQDRASLLTDILTIWRWGRQADIARGRPIGSFEKWARWCRDPLLALGCRDPIERIDAIKASDPRRAAMVAFFETFWEHHASQRVRASDLDEAIIELADPKAARKDGKLCHSRQRVAGFLNQHVGTRVGGFCLSRYEEWPKSKPIYSYQLTNEAASYQPGPGRT
jgi:hypothetical protein